MYLKCFPLKKFSSLSKERVRNPLPTIEKVNLRTFDNVFVYSNIIEQTLIGESQANTLNYVYIKFNFGERGVSAPRSPGAEHPI